GKLVLIDFGTAREETLTYLCKQQGKPGTSINSVGYTPYEQQQGRAEPRSDFFALGRTFVFLLTGKTPREFEDSITKGLQWQDSASGYAKPLRDFLDELMQPDVTKRPANTAVILSTMQGLEKQLQPQYYSSPPILAIPGWMSPQRVMVKTWEITDKLISTTASMVAYSCGYILGIMTWAVRSVFSLVSVGIIGIIELISTLFSFIFGGIAYLFEAVWSGLQAFGEALGNFCRSCPWKSFAWILIYFAFMGYLISPWNQEFIILGILTIFLVILINIFEAINKDIATFCLMLFYLILLGYIAVIAETIRQIESNLKLTLYLDIIVMPGWLFLVAVSVFSILLLLIALHFEDSREYELKNIVLKSVTLSLGLGIGWMIYQHFPIVESPPPLLEIFKDLLKN
ncbi:MAG: hypothetical protein ACRCU2_16770, partial [Planktothrix sp.]